MRNKSNKRIYHFLLFSTMAAVLLLGCGPDDDMNPPIITEVRNYAASPNDTVVQALETSQWVVLTGRNLDNVVAAFFGGTQATINSALVTGQNMIIQVPSIPFQSVPRNRVNEIMLVNKNGVVTTYSINIKGAPLISEVRNYAAPPNDTIVNVIKPGQQINLIGYNLKDATAITFQGVNADLANVIYTDTSAIVQLPDDFSASNLVLKDKISFTTSIGSTTFSIKIKVPVVVGPLAQLLTGGVGPGKAWVYGASSSFKGPLFWGGVDLGWNRVCTKPNGSCAYDEWTWQSWMGPGDPATTDFGSMTFTVSDEGTFVTVDQKVISTKGVYDGSYALDESAKTIIFIGVDPLRMGWNDAKYRDVARILILTDSTMQLAFNHVNKSEFQIFNFIKK
ncbi:hypothetical protein [Ohtaekwangia koreensis]|uniref:Lipocalin-like domain-containing protein n=1 Tax=Ohtaekwangia koreensis TaxID=688867 RepID=A0A1T5KIV4_9BACT|nr:hypothetical protein [Ohtaekwangia koreensis]SKC63590.1 hypothetical protein SAMN05660236_2235 [Ohtaekwangia koreensis]